MRTSPMLSPADMEGKASTARKADVTGKSQVMLVGFDWGTNKSCVQAVMAGAAGAATSVIVPTVVGYANDGIVDNLLPGNVRILYGEEALKRRLHLRLVQPMRDGVIEDLAASKDFARHLVGQLNAPEGAELRAVIGLPANAERAARENLRQAVAGVFDKVILVPEPFLAALGYRDEAKLNDPDYVDPVSNSLFVDIGAGTTDVCMIQGYYPTGEDQISLPFAGDKVDQMLNEAIKKNYPDVALSMIKVREIKEEHSYVGKLEDPIVVSVVVGGKMRKLDLGPQIGECCTELLVRIFEAIKILIGRASSDSVTELLRNIVLTGGGNCIRNLESELQRMLTEEGYESPRVTSVGQNYKEFVARGALKAARQAKETQWQQLIA